MKPYLSPSQLNTACRCPEAYRRSYIEGEKIPPGIAAHTGTGVHAGAAANFRQKQFSHNDLPVADIVEASVAGFEEAVSSRGTSFSDSDRSRGTGLVISEEKDRVARLAEVHAVTVQPEYQPVPESVEQSVRITLPDSSHDLLGVVDLIDEKDRVVDFKTAKRKKSQRDADDSVQLTFYAAAHEIRTGTPPSSVRLDVLVATRRGIQRQVVESTRTSADYDALSHRAAAVIAMKDAGVYLPAEPGSWCCSPRWCGYWNTCPYVNSEREARSE